MIDFAAIAMYCPNCGCSLPDDSRFCSACGQPVQASPASAALVPAPPGSAGSLTFFPVATHKFVILSLCSFGIYELYWCYQQWARIRQSSGEELSPIWRTIFAPLCTFSLLSRIRAYAQGAGVAVGWSAGLLGLAFAILSVVWRLPSPWWLISHLSMLPLVPVVRTCAKINATVGNPEGLNSRYSVGNVCTVIGGGLLFLLAALAAFFPE